MLSYISPPTPFIFNINQSETKTIHENSFIPHNKSSVIIVNVPLLQINPLAWAYFIFPSALIHLHHLHVTNSKKNSLPHVSTLNASLSGSMPIVVWSYQLCFSDCFHLQLRSALLMTKIDISVVAWLVLSLAQKRMQ